MTFFLATGTFLSETRSNEESGGSIFVRLPALHPAMHRMRMRTIDRFNFASLQDMRRLRISHPNPKDVVFEHRIYMMMTLALWRWNFSICLATAHIITLSSCAPGSAEY